ncbi:glycosyltransferase family 2 protein [Salipaludibacillus agaradhaerens]|uniref:glycosyltransferase family 2 protein n=1 Tax=Salipaludibacillus agaradhaerens TaxID=76935 RepID=UPI0021515DB9|nr:glycosyltransferase family 2 protein [Salipaludibacillus agaradhaerens]MCR6106828.1 glycosyltransferase family 2 protein [Salipaludibacillus agaradhaerens]MCR6118860.1 glycosyltransferase family 2 protein [Salipaludibacillus agaradhaerens]
MIKLTVFTPTYNRGYCLHQCYESLKRQTNKHFIWLIIDDGSTDNTETLVKQWIDEQELNINYVKQANQGMHGAHNTAYETIDTELNVCLDSDDMFHEEAVDRILSFWKAYGSNKVSGFVALNANDEGDILGSELPKGITSSTLFDLYYKHGITGDKKLIYRTEVAKNFPYPLFEGEKYVGLAYKYYKLDEQYPLLLMNQVVCLVEYRSDGSTMNMLRQYKTNPKGFAFYRHQLMTLSLANTTFKFRQAIHYVSSSLLSKNKAFFKESPAPWLTVAALPFGVCLYVYINFKFLKELKGSH